MTRTHRIGKLWITTTRQATTRRIVDDAWLNAIDGRKAKGKAIILNLWPKRRNHYGEWPGPQLALVIAWEVARSRG